jgi:Flp pilus assembly protein TadB
MTNEELAVKVQRVDDRSRSNSHRLDEVEKKLADNDEMLASIARLDQRQKDMDTDVKEIKADVKALAGKPGKRWETVVDKALMAAVTAIVGYIVIKLGLGG